MRTRPHFLRIAFLVGLSSVVACSSVGPKYQRPSVETPAAYKEAGAMDPRWKIAEPKDASIRGRWWEAFQDPELSSLESQVNLSNQNIAAAFQAFLQARALVKQARAQYFPTLSVNPAVTVQGGQLSASGIYSSASGTFTEYTVPLDASWQPDLWGRISSSVRQNSALAEVSAADLENERLSQQGDLAVDYYELRAQDSMIDLYGATVDAYRKSLELTRSLEATGIDSAESTAQAEVQLETAEAQSTNLGIARAQYEHAIALLCGKPASSFSIAHGPLKVESPKVPIGVPSLLLERRPDIAAAERAMAAANAQIGVAQSAYYPSLTLNASGGIEGNSIAGLLAAPQLIWSLGADLVATLFDGGLRGAVVEQDQAAYDQSVAAYRQTVLAAFQQVEDLLAGLRILSLEIGQTDATVLSAERYLAIATHRYRAGIDPYLTVITAQLSLLTSRQSAVALRMTELTDSVQLIESLGGGWDRAELSKTL